MDLLPHKQRSETCVSVAATSQHEGGFWKAFARDFERPNEALVQPPAPGQRRPAKVLTSRRLKSNNAAAAAASSAEGGGNEELLH